MIDPHRIPDMSDQEAEKYISKSLRHNANQRSQPLITIIARLPSHNSPSAIERGGEGFGEPHGTADGSLWAGLGAPERLTYVQGYLACRDAYSNVKAFRRASVIEDQISRWYGLRGKFVDKDGLPSGNEAHEVSKIGDLIDRFNQLPQKKPD